MIERFVGSHFARLCWWSGIEFIVLAVIAIVRTHLWTYGADTGIFAQLIANAPSGMHDGVEKGSHFHFHWSPALALLWPLVAFTHSALGLQLLQAAAAAATAPLLYLLLRPYIGSVFAFRVGLIALLYPPLISLGFGEFHELGLFPPIAIGMVLAADRARWWVYAACALFAIGLREDVCLQIALLGLLFVWVGIHARTLGHGIFDFAPSNPRALIAAGALTFVTAMVTFVAYFEIIVPHFGGWGSQHFYRYTFAQGPINVLAASVLHPLQFASAILTAGRFGYVLEAIVPLALLPLVSEWALLAVPGAIMVLLANSGYVWRMGDHYAALWIPWLLIAAGLGAGAIARRRGERTGIVWTNAAMGLCILFLVAFDPMHPVHYLKPNYYDLTDARRALACVPVNASLSTHDEWYSAIAASYPYATVERSNGVEYLVYADDFADPRYQHRIRPALQAEVQDGRYHAICHFGNVTTSTNLEVTMLSFGKISDRTVPRLSRD